MRSFIVAILLFTIGLGFSGMPHMAMSMNAHGVNMHDCPFSPGTLICDMTISQHLTAIQSAFAVLPTDASSFFVVMILLTLFSVAAWRVIILLAPTPPPLFAYAVARREDTYSPPHTLLQELFSRGILRTKAF